MFDEAAFKHLLSIKNKNMSEVAKAMGISKSTLYKKMHGDSDFYISEMKKCCDFLGEKDLDFIFFKEEVSFEETISKIMELGGKTHERENHKTIS